MRASTAIKKIMKQNGWTQAQMAKAVGVKSQKAIGMRLNRPNMTFDLALEMLDKMGYEIVIQPVSAGKRKEGAVVITRVDEE